MVTRLFVGNLSFAATEDGLRSCYGADGRQVASVRIMLDRETGRSRGFAFVDMASDADAKAAIAALREGVEGRPLRGNEAMERPERPAGGGASRGPAPRRDGPGGGPSRPSGGAAPRRFDDPPRGGRGEVRRGDGERLRDDSGGKKSRRPRDDDDDGSDWD